MKKIDSTNRWSGNGYGKERALNKGVDLTTKQWYSYPGDSKGNGYFKVWADTYEELQEKIEKAHADRKLQTSQRKDQQRMVQGRYMVSGEPYA